MIVKLEIERFIQEIEGKIPNLKGKALENANDKVLILCMALKEIKESHAILKESMLMTSSSEIDFYKLLMENRDLKIELKNLKENINA